MQVLSQWIEREGKRLWWQTIIDEEEMTQESISWMRREFTFHIFQIVLNKWLKFHCYEKKKVFHSHNFFNKMNCLSKEYTIISKF